MKSKDPELFQEDKKEYGSGHTPTTPSPMKLLLQ